MHLRSCFIIQDDTHAYEKHVYNVDYDNHNDLLYVQHVITHTDNTDNTVIHMEMADMDMASLLQQLRIEDWMYGGVDICKEELLATLVSQLPPGLTLFVI